ncbi:MAG: hypothetical protein MUP64_12415 [Anaerolineae bacterium]|nr:hypothetical protein [Anaerolineae bacterium]
MRAVHTPTCVLVQGCLYEDNGEGQVRSRLGDLLGLLQANVTSESEQGLIAHGEIDEDYELYVKLLPGHDYCVLQVWATPIADDFRDSFDRVLHFVNSWWPHPVGAHLLTDLPPLFSFNVLACQETLSEDELATLFPDGPELVSSMVHSGRALLIAGHKPPRHLYVVTPVQAILPSELLSTVIDDVSRMEMYFNKIMSFYDVYPEIYAGVSAADEEVIVQMDEISGRLSDADTTALGNWLARISHNYGNLSNISKGLRQDSFSLHSNLSNINSILRTWDEERASSQAPISEVLLNDAGMVCGAYDGLSDRIQGIQSQLGNMIAMVRARIELGQQEQSLQQLTDLVKMQKSMNVLEFVFLAAVLLEIFGFIFAGLGEVWGRASTTAIGFHYVLTHLAEYPALLTALFAPAVLVLSYVIVRLAGRLIH